MALQMMGPFTGNLLPVMDLHQPACLICLASTECFVQLMHVTYVLPVTQVHHIYFFCLSYTKPTASEAGCPVSSTYMVRLSLTLEFWWNLVVNLKPLCRDNNWPSLHALPFRKVRAPSHRIIQLHHNVFVLLVIIHDSGKKKKWQMLDLRVYLPDEFR